MPEYDEFDRISDELDGALAPAGEASAEAASVTERPAAVGTLEEDESDPVAEMRAALRFAPGDWFVVHSYAGYENKVKTNLETRITSLDMEEFIYQVEVPTRDEVEVKNGKRLQVQNKVFPGYILVRMELTPESYSCVRDQGVTGFVGATDRADRPAPLSLDEVLKWLAPASTTDAKKAKPEIKVVDFEVGPTRSLSPTARSRRCRRRSARSTPTSRSSRCWCRSSAGRLRWSSTSTRSPRSSRIEGCRGSLVGPPFSPCGDLCVTLERRARFTCAPLCVPHAQPLTIVAINRAW